MATGRAAKRFTDRARKSAAMRSAEVGQIFKVVHNTEYGHTFFIKITAVYKQTYVGIEIDVGLPSPNGQPGRSWAFHHDFKNAFYDEVITNMYNASQQK